MHRSVRLRRTSRILLLSLALRWNSLYRLSCLCALIPVRGYNLEIMRHLLTIILSRCNWLLFWSIKRWLCAVWNRYRIVQRCGLLLHRDTRNSTDATVIRDSGNTWHLWKFTLVHHKTLILRLMSKALFLFQIIVFRLLRIFTALFLLHLHLFVLLGELLLVHLQLSSEFIFHFFVELLFSWKSNF